MYAVLRQLKQQVHQKPRFHSNQSDNDGFATYLILADPVLLSAEVKVRRDGETRKMQQGSGIAKPRCLYKIRVGRYLAPFLPLQARAYYCDCDTKRGIKGRTNCTNFKGTFQLTPPPDVPLSSWTLKEF
jgi:hypothetical protein